MNLLHVATTYPLHEADSNAIFVEALAEALCRRGHTVRVLLPWHPQLSLQRNGRSARLETFAATPFRAWHPWGYAQALTADRSLRWDAIAVAPYATMSGARGLRRMMDAEPADVVHAHWLLPGGAVGALALRGRRQPLVISCHGSGVFVAERRGFARRAARWALRRAAAVTACSRDLAARVAALGAGPEPEWIPYGVDAERFRPLEPEARAAQRRALSERHAIPADGPWVLAVGRLVHKKGFDRLVEALPPLLEAVADARVVIVGDGPLGDALMERARSGGVDGHLHLVGAAPNSELPGWYAAADVVAVPSVHGPSGNVDGLPNVFLEALASGTAVVASDVAGIPDIGRDGDTVVLVPEHDAAGLAAALAGLLRDPARRTALGAAARGDVLQRLEWDRIAARFEALYEGVLRR